MVGSEVTQGLVGTDGVVGPLLGLKLLVQGPDVQVPCIDFIDPFGVGPLGPLHVPVGLRETGWQHQEAKASALAFPLKACLELTASVLHR